MAIAPRGLLRGWRWCPRGEGHNQSHLGMAERVNSPDHVLQAIMCTISNNCLIWPSFIFTRQYNPNSESKLKTLLQVKSSLFTPEVDIIRGWKPFYVRVLIARLYSPNGHLVNITSDHTAAYLKIKPTALEYIFPAFQSQNIYFFTFTARHLLTGGKSGRCITSY